MKIERAFQPKAAISDERTLGFTFTVDDQFRAGRVQLDLDIDHANRSDLEVYLCSPSGNRAILLDHTGAANRDFKGTFDLTSVFDREEVKGEWKLVVTDAGKGDVGRLNSWGVRLEPGEARPIPAEQGPADDQTLYAGRVSVGATRTADGRYALLDRSRGQGIETVDLVDSFNDATAKPIFDQNGAWGESADSARQRTAVDAQYAAQMTYDYLRDVFGRDSLDGRGEKLSLRVHAGPFPRPRTMWMGNSVGLFDGENGASARSTVDIVGSALGSGLVQRVGRIDGSGEQWAVGDALGQILGGVGVEWYAAQRNPTLAAATDPYRIGEQVEGVDGWVPIELGDPAKDGDEIDHYSAYRSNRPMRGSGIALNAFYLLAHGGTNKTSGHEVDGGVGLEASLKIFGRALFDELPTGATFAQTRQATIAAATKLFGADSTEVHKVQEAWTAVGVLAP